MSIFTDNPFTAIPLPAALNSEIVFDNRSNLNTKIGFYMDISNIASVQFYSSVDGTNFYLREMTNLDTAADSTSATVSGNFTGDISGTQYFKILVNSGGTVAGSITGLAVV